MKWHAGCLAAALVGSLAACAAPEQFPANMCADLGDVTVTVLWTITPQAQMKENAAQNVSFREGLGTRFSGLQGYSSVAGQGDKAMLLMSTMAPRSPDDSTTLETICHELQHWRRGNFHDMAGKVTSTQLVRGPGAAAPAAAVLAQGPAPTAAAAIEPVQPVGPPLN
jgi:hypothetical protein